VQAGTVRPRLSRPGARQAAVLPQRAQRVKGLRRSACGVGDGSCRQRHRRRGRRGREPATTGTGGAGGKPPASGAAASGTGGAGGGTRPAASANGAAATGGGGGTTAATEAGSGAAKFVKPARRLVKRHRWKRRRLFGALSAEAAVCSDSGMAEGAAAKFWTMSRQGTPGLAAGSAVAVALSTRTGTTAPRY